MVVVSQWLVWPAILSNVVGWLILCKWSNMILITSITLVRMILSPCFRIKPRIVKVASWHEHLWLDLHRKAEACCVLPSCVSIFTEPKMHDCSVQGDYPSEQILLVYSLFHRMSLGQLEHSLMMSYLSGPSVNAGPL